MLYNHKDSISSSFLKRFGKSLLLSNQSTRQPAVRRHSNPSRSSDLIAASLIRDQKVAWPKKDDVCSPQARSRGPSSSFGKSLDFLPNNCFQRRPRNKCDHLHSEFWIFAWVARSIRKSLHSFRFPRKRDEDYFGSLREFQPPLDWAAVWHRLVAFYERDHS